MSAQEIRSFPVCMDLVDSLEEPKVLDQAKTSYRHRERNRERDHVSRFQTLETRPSLGNLEYRPLRPDKRDIRLLILEPTVSHTINIDASMETISLDAKPTYEALSYTWGPSKRPSGKIYVDGYELDVADTLFDALDSLRRNQNGEQRRIWADAICINQKDPQEKSWQIQLMASIYKCASRTLIWVELSGAVNLTAVSQLTARKFLADMEQIEKDADSDDQSRFKLINSSLINGLPLVDDCVDDCTSDSSTTKKWKVIKEILSNSWWERRWVVQEAFFSKRPIVFSGQTSDTVSLDKFAKMAVWHHEYVSGRQHVPEIIRTLFNSCPFYPLLKQWKSYRADPSVYRAPLPRWMTLTKDFKQGLSRDMVSGLLSLASPEDQLNIKPDYYHLDEIVFKSIFAYLTKAYGINPIRFKPWEIMFCLPSWCGLWGSGSQQGSMLDFAARRGRKSFNAGGKTKRVARFLETSETPWQENTDGRKKSGQPLMTSLLSIRGIYVDEVAVVIPSGITTNTIHTSGLTNIEENFRSAISCWQRRCSGINKAPYDGGFDSQWGICRTLLGDWTEGLLNEDWVAHFQLWLKGKSCWQASNCRKTTSIETENCSKSGLSRPRWKDDCFYKGSRKCCFNRSLIITVRGFIGLAPLNTMMGDTISVIYGSSIPLVLRKNGDVDTYSLVGETYVHGIMYGEAVQAKEERFPEGEFLLI